MYEKMYSHCENEIKAGLSKSNIDEESLKSIFETIDRADEKGKRKDWIGNQYLLAGAKVYIPQFTDME